jgi:putative restriction endonuclease
MSHAVFTIKVGSGYDDIPEEKYHFPAQYLARARQTIGDVIVYYEPRRGNGRQSYIAAACVDGIDRDPQREDHYYAKISGYLNFDAPVPFRVNGNFYEAALRSGGRTGLSGDFRNAVRPLPQPEFEAIVAAGFASHQPSTVDSRADSGMYEEPSEFQRPIVERLVHKAFREAAFSRQVKSAYAHRCAFTGLDMRNGGGRSEVDAAHIKPVGDGHNGPDSIRNGLALSKTVHWMFDRGLISVDGNYKILVAGSLVPDPLRALFHRSGEILVPQREQEKPHPAFLRYHRNTIFKGSQV